jgi:GntR family transcriptional regulator
VTAAGPGGRQAAAPRDRPAAGHGGEAEIQLPATPRLRGALPLWYQLAQSLRAAILSPDHPGATRLPTEVELARHFGVSLATVRQALASLAADGLITRHRRRGTFVNADARRSRALRVIGSADAVAAQQASDEVRVLGRDRVPLAAGPARRLAGPGSTGPGSTGPGSTGPGEVAPGEEAVLIRRLRLDAGVPVSYAENYLRPLHADRISDAALARAPVTALLRDELGLGLTRIDNEVSARSAPAELAGLLGVEPFSPVLVSENVTYAVACGAVDVARIYYRGDRFTFAISLDLP